MGERFKVLYQFFCASHHIMLWNLQSDKEQMCLSPRSSVTIFYSSVSADVVHLSRLDLEGLLPVPSLCSRHRPAETSPLLLSMARLIKIHKCQSQGGLFCTAWWLGATSSVGHCADSRSDGVSALLEPLGFRRDLNRVPFQREQTTDSNQTYRETGEDPERNLQISSWIEISLSAKWQAWKMLLEVENRWNGISDIGCKFAQKWNNRPNHKHYVCLCLCAEPGARSLLSLPASRMIGGKYPPHLVCWNGLVIF